jgi:hypothetical protein
VIVASNVIAGIPYLFGVWALPLAKAPAMVGDAGHKQRNGYIAQYG